MKSEVFEFVGATDSNKVLQTGRILWKKLSEIWYEIVDSPPPTDSSTSPLSIFEEKSNFHMLLEQPRMLLLRYSSSMLLHHY